MGSEASDRRETRSHLSFADELHICQLVSRGRAILHAFLHSGIYSFLHGVHGGEFQNFFHDLEEIDL